MAAQAQVTATGTSVAHAGPDDDRARDGNLFADDADQGDLPDCQTCGACCSYSAEWPRFTAETDEALDRVPPQFVSEDLSGMRCEGQRCSALSGRVGESTSCVIYDVRPDVCRACLPGDPECRTARWAFGLEKSQPGPATF